MTFHGFTPPVSNYFRMPNEWIDICSEIKSLAELKVVQYVLRHTWGWQEYDGQPKTITTDEFMHGRKDKNGNRIDKGTGLSNRSVIDGLRDAINHGFLICATNDKDKARIIKSYALNMTTPDSDVKKVHTGIGYEESSQPDMKILHTDMKKVHSYCEDSSQRSEKETKERNLKKNTKERKNGTPNIFAKQEATHSSIHSSHPQSQKSFSQKTKQEEEVTLSETEEVIYGYACQTIFKAKPPKKTPKLKGECAEVAKHVKTVEQFISLVQFVRALPYIQGQVHLKNLVNELNGWLQIQKPIETPATASLPKQTTNLLELYQMIHGERSVS